MSRTTWRTTIATLAVTAAFCTTPALAQSAESTDSDKSGGASPDSSSSHEDSSPGDSSGDAAVGDVGPDSEIGATGSIQPGSMESGSSVESALGALLRTLLSGSSGSSLSTSGNWLNIVLDLLPLVGSSEVTLPSSTILATGDYPKAVDESIQAPQLISRVPEEGNRLERWTIASPSMARNVEVQVMLPADDSTPAPMLYLLDGVDANTKSDWLTSGRVGTFFAQEQVTLVMPTQAKASMYSDWESDDPHLGRNMWETFLTEELPPLLEAESDLNFNGKRGIGGLSMGATGAVHLANSHPEFYGGVFGLSGCYSTLDPVGRQTAHLTVTSRGGTLENMWGPFGSETWAEHDVTANPEGLRDMAVYLSAANGEYLFDPERDYSNVDPMTMSTAILLEQGALVCTQDLDQAMTSAGMDHQKVEYTGAGVHNWANFRPQLDAAWDTISPALQ
ncbi:alpha/beta hydrolase [Corynebacterium sp. A21]|uniref:alpha/beta hydrolase n=1 Tax=Corynebacterium sp. A21 TaxID=3457318 RepID=UPI003FCEF58B